MTRSPRLSLRARLLAGLITVTAVFLVVMGTVSAFVISGHLQAQFDDSLLAAVSETPAQLKASPAYAVAGVGPRGTVVPYGSTSRRTRSSRFPVPPSRRPAGESGWRPVSPASS